jgi:hypothetical protein
MFLKRLDVAHAQCGTSPSLSGRSTVPHAALDLEIEMMPQLALELGLGLRVPNDHSEPLHESPKPRHRCLRRD